jgi:hypothetical protein
VIKRELRRRSAIEAVIGHMKTDGHLGRCHLKGRAGDAADRGEEGVGNDNYRFTPLITLDYFSYWKIDPRHQPLSGR